MKKIAAIGSLACLWATASQAQQPATLDQVREELAALSARVDRLEQDNAALRSENEELRAGNAGPAEQAAKTADAERVAKAAEWVSRIGWKADFRYRHENVDPEEAAADQHRQRIRARFGMTARISDSLSATVQLATTGGNGDPRSANQTLGEGWTRKDIGLDLAYLEWKAAEGLQLQAGKMPQPWRKVPSMLWDGDITPEGIAVRYARGPFFANAFGHYLSERSGASDATLMGAQLGATVDLGAAKLMGALGYYDVGGVQGQITTAAAGCSVNNAFFGGPQGNTTVPVGGCATLANDFDLLEGLLQADFTLGRRPLSLFAHYLENREAASLNSAWSAGVTYGRASAPGSWEVGYLYQATEKDSQFGQFVESDFAGGVTDSQGSVLRLGYALAPSWVLNGAWFENERFVDAPGAVTRDYRRYQLDLNFRF